ncbi:ABC transporter ATP-binding protein [Cohnella luojiensis]|uniref:ABC transporter ATP-binding protein n=1 Tax=Cohnella luojiensis TaxID=652876 RepID=A0A4Y8LNX9_9BACL|nr:ABC transporter ATP-binding protein [Cohnella luojiensis]TFE22632.1 ABC transporter ATP-binding protein [Cohnella luojiensis]
MEPILYFAKRLHSFTGMKLYVNLFGTVMVSLLEGIGILLLVPMISMSGIAGVNKEATPLSGMIGALQSVPKQWILPIILVSFVLLVIGQGLLKRSIGIQNVKIHQGFVYHLRSETYRALLQSKWDFFIMRRKSDFINSLTAEIGRVSGGVSVSLQLLASIIFTLIQIGLAFWLSPELTLFVIVCGFALAFLSRKFIQRSKSLGNLTLELSKQYMGGITDQLNGIKDIKINMLERSRLSWLHHMNMKMQQEHGEYFKLKATSQFYYQVASALLVAAFIFLSIQMFEAKVEQLLLVIIIFSRLWPRFTGFQSSLENIASSIPSFNNIIKLQEDCKEATEFSIAEQQGQNVKMITIEKSLECRNVYFRYNRQESQYALQDINLHIPSNRMTAIVGRSGAGKSTLIDILMGLVMPEQGQVIIDGIPLTSDRLLSLRRSISYVPQDPFLFNETIRENLLMVKPHASEKEIWEALEFSVSADFIRRLPQGLDTFIGDRGIRLSGGERQRLVLARAILRNPSILVLDEATSALDTENESKIQEALEQLKGKMTIIVIAHRLSTIRNADQVIVIDQGRIVQKGIFSQLANEKKSMLNHLLEHQAIVWPHASGEE